MFLKKHAAHAAVAVSLAVAGHGAVGGSTMDIAAYEQTAQRDDAAGPVRATLAAAACTSGVRNTLFANPADGCGEAHDAAVEAGRYDDALKLAVTGCTRHRNAVDCRRAARLPLLMGNSGTPVPVSYAAALARVARVVCASGVRLNQAYGRDAAGRECVYLARHFNLAADPEYRFGLQQNAREYFAAIHDRALTASLLKASCERRRGSEACDELTTFHASEGQ
jgi:hypothetical protein